VRFGGLTLVALGVAVVALAGSGCDDAREAPARTCAFHDECDEGWLCGPAGECVAAAACAEDAACCPGAVCFNGWCRPTLDCDGGARACDGLGAVCEAGRCVPAPCQSDAGCPKGRRCVAGRCLDGPPCGAGCPDGEACHAPSGRCVPAAGCPGSCGEGARPVVAGWSPVDALWCGRVDHPCECAPLPEVPRGTPGFDGRLVTVEGEPLLISYDPRYGDLVASRFDPDGGREDQVLDGVPARPPVGASAGYRGGVDDPGPDRGRRPALVRSPGASTAVDVLYRDLGVAGPGGVRHLRYDAASGEVTAESLLPIEGLAGRYSCLAPRGGGVAGLVFVERDAADTHSELLAVEALTATPGAPEDWRITHVARTPLPPRAEDPCEGACGLTEVCVRSGPGADRCGAVMGTAAGCGAGCAVHEVCAEVDGAPPRCLPRVYPRLDADRLPFGRGLFVTCAADLSGELLAAWYDADAGALIASRWPFLPSSWVAVDGGGGQDRGRHASLAVAPDGRVGVAYRDERRGALRFASAPAVTGPWTAEEVHADPAGPAAGDLGAWATLMFFGSTPLVAHGDAARGEIWLTARGAAGCWGHATVFGGGGYTFPGLAPDPSDPHRALVSALALAFAADLSPAHAPRLASVPRPSCP